MMNWFDLMRQAQDGAGLDNLARQFGLSQEQAGAAVAALMPAFAMGLQRAAMDPNAMAQLTRIMTGGHYPAFWESASQAFTPQARQEGKHVLDQLFGSDEVSRRVAHQAAAFSGVGADVLQQMLPLLAGIIAGGLAKVASGHGAMFSPPSPPTPGPSAPSGQTGIGAWADLWGLWMGAGARAEPTSPSPARQPEAKPEAPAHPFEEMMASFLGVPAKPQPREQAEPRPEPQQVPPPQSAETPDAANPFQAWGEMMEKGQEMQRQHLQSLQSILEGVWGQGQKRS